RPVVRPTTYAKYEVMVRLYLKPGLGRHRLDRLSVATVQSYFNDRLRAGDSAAKSPGNTDGARCSADSRDARGTDPPERRPACHAAPSAAGTDSTLGGRRSSRLPGCQRDWSRRQRVAAACHCLASPRTRWSQGRAPYPDLPATPAPGTSWCSSPALVTPSNRGTCRAPSSALPAKP